MTDAVIFIILMAGNHVPVVGYAIYGAIKLAKLKKDPNYRAEVKKKGPQPIKMVQSKIGRASCRERV